MNARRERRNGIAVVRYLRTHGAPPLATRCVLVFVLPLYSASDTTLQVGIVLWLLVAMTVVTALYRVVRFENVVLLRVAPAKAGVQYFFLTETGSPLSRGRRQNAVSTN